MKPVKFVLLALGALCAIAVFLPFVALSPHGVWHAVTTQTSRPLQIESLAAGFLLVAHVVGGLGLTMQSGHGSQNLAGGGPDALTHARLLNTIGSAAGLRKTSGDLIDDFGDASLPRAPLGELIA